jgi:IS1 family transposase
MSIHRAGLQVVAEPDPEGSRLDDSCTRDGRRSPCVSLALVGLERCPTIAVMEKTKSVRAMMSFMREETSFVPARRSDTIDRANVISTKTWSKTARRTLSASRRAAVLDGCLIVAA